MPVVELGVVGDYVDGHANHIATDAAIEHAGNATGIATKTTWIPTEDVAADGDASLRGFDALFMATGTYLHPAGALAAITYARTRDVPLIGTCGGFQHIVVEFARNVAGIDGAAHQQYEPDAAVPVINELACSLRGQIMDVRIIEETRAHAAYGTTEATERYYCQFGVNHDYLDTIVGAGLTVTATDGEGEPRIVELPDLHFYVGTLFVPQASSTPDAPHPLIVAFLSAARDRVSVTR